MSETTNSNFRRKVFYIPGFDPFPARRYRELYRRESSKQAQISGYKIGLSPLHVENGFGWHVQGCFEGKYTETEFEVLSWSDIVRASMQNTRLGLYVLLVKTAWIYVSTGALRQLMKLRVGPIIAALYPPFVLILQALLAFGFGSIAALLSSSILGLVGVSWPNWVIWGICGTVFCGGIVAAFKVASYLEPKLYAQYLMQDFTFSAAEYGATPKMLEPRMEAFSEKIFKATSKGYDEVLIVGHSSGAYLAVSVLARVLAMGKPVTKLGFLSLGQVVPMVSFLPKADRLRRDLHSLSASPDLTWVDVSALGDGCCFALCDPVAVSGAAPNDKRWPLVISAAFQKTLSKETLRALRWRYFRVHFQYLCAFDRPGDYDYFQITAGPLSLEERYKGRKPSPSRLETAVNPYPLRPA
jgi:hypothetical protein